MSDVLSQLVEMSHALGDPAKPFAILGEGNTSARIDDDSFYVKASGTTLHTITPDEMLAVSISKVTGILDDPEAGDDDVTRVLREALLDPAETRRPSVETMLHALIYKYPEFRFIGHTHPVATNGLLCSKNAKEAALGRTCPDHIVVMSHKSVFVPYVDPGLVLARVVRDSVAQFVEEENELPKAIMQENHGLFALGTSAKEVVNITEMAEKASNTILGCYAMGGPKWMTQKEVDRIHTRPDEHYRQNIM